MKTFEELKTQVKRYLTSNTNLVNVVPGQAGDVETLMANIDAAILNAANSARRQAEMRHDFAVSIMTGSVPITGGTDIDLDAIPTDDEDVVLSFKTLNGVWIDSGDGTNYPIKVISRQTKMVQLFKQQDLDTGSYQGGYTAVVTGRRLQIEGLATGTVLNLVIVGSVWMDDFYEEVVGVEADPEADPPVEAVEAVEPVYHWFLERGFEYLQWAVICDINYMLLKFVPRQEGTLAPPEKSRDLALDALITNDSYSLEGGIYNEL
jgi:hypothetical protein